MKLWGRAPAAPVTQPAAAPVTDPAPVHEPTPAAPPSPNAGGPMARFIDGAFAYMGAGGDMDDREARARHVRDFARIFVGPLGAVEAVASEKQGEPAEAPASAVEAAPAPVRRVPGVPLPSTSQRDRDRAAMLTRRAVELRGEGAELPLNGTH